MGDERDAGNKVNSGGGLRKRCSRGGRDCKARGESDTSYEFFAVLAVGR